MATAQFGDWRPSPTGFKYHYGHGAVAICGQPRLFSDSNTAKDKCATCLKKLARRTKEEGREMTEAEAAKKANEMARKIVGDHVVKVAGYPSEGMYQYLKGDLLVPVVEKALLEMYSSGVHDGINEG